VNKKIIYNKNKKRIMKKKVQSYNIDENLINMFDVVAAFKKDVKSEVVNNAIRDYIIKNKASVNETMLELFKNDDNIIIE